jgi:hypothetical protein
MRTLSARIAIMRFHARTIIIATGLAGLIAPALAADITGPEIKAFVSGKTIYLETTPDSATGTAGQGAIYFAEDGSALYKTPMGALWHGKWEIKDNTNCTNWKERQPPAACTRWDKTGDAYSLIDAGSGKVRAKVVKTAPGNAEKLGP